MAEFVLDVHDIDETGKAYDFAIRQAWLVDVLEDTRVSPNAGAPEGRLRVRAHRQGLDIVVLGRLTASLVAECARCLDEAPVAVDAQLGSLLTARGATQGGSALRPEPDDAELTPEEIDREFYSGDRIVLDAMVREHLLLEVPLKPLCQDDCAGIPVPPSVSGLDRVSAEDEIDPRLAPLLSLVGRVKPTKE